MTEMEPLPYLGDIMFLSAIRPLWSGKTTALSVISRDVKKPPLQQELLCVNEVGRALLAGKQHWLALKGCDEPSERWVGGVSSNADGRCWHWSEQKKQPVLFTYA